VKRNFYWITQFCSAKRHCSPNSNA